MYHNFFIYSSLCLTIPVCPSKHLFISCLLFHLYVNCLPLLCLKSLPSHWWDIQFSWVSPMCAYYKLDFFLVNLSHVNLIIKPAKEPRKEKGKVFLLYIRYVQKCHCGKNFNYFFLFVDHISKIFYNTCIILVISL